MDLFIKQRVFSWGQKFDIYDVSGKPVYHVAGEIFTFGRKLHIYDMSGNEIIYIKQRLFRFMPHYEIYIKGVHAATIIKKFTFFSHNFYYEKLNWQVEGDFFAHDYRITCGGDSVVSITKRWFAWGDTYDLSINDRYDPLLALASCIAIDCACHENK